METTTTTTIVKTPICNHGTKCLNEDTDHRKNFLHSSPKPCNNPNCSNPKCIFQHSEKSNDSDLRKRIEELEKKSNYSDLQKHVEELEKKYVELATKYDRLVDLIIQSKVSPAMPLPTFQPLMQQPMIQQPMIQQPLMQQPYQSYTTQTQCKAPLKPRNNKSKQNFNGFQTQ